MPVTLHVRHQADPDYILDLLSVLLGGPDTVTNLGAVAEANGHPTGTLTEQLGRLAALGLVVRTKGGLNSLTDIGESLAHLARTRQGVYHDLMHFMHYGRWSARAPMENGYSWTYQTICSELWACHTADIDTGRLAEIASLKAQDMFGDSGSVSTGTGRGVITWLRKLNPPVLEGTKTFRLRSVCSPELMVAAINWVHTEDGLSFGDLFALDEGRRSRLAQACMVSTAAIPQLLDEVTLRFDWVERQSGWVDYVRVRKQCHFRDFLFNDHV